MVISDHVTKNTKNNEELLTINKLTHDQIEKTLDNFNGFTLF